MRALFSLFTILLSMAFFVTGVVYLIARTFGQIAWNPESKAFKRMLEMLRARVKDLSAALVPWDQEMLGLLSSNRVNTQSTGWFRPFSTGQFTTIYQEPVVAFIAQQSGKVRVTVARTSDREFIFRVKDRDTEIWLNGQPFGLFSNGVLLSPGKNPKQMARLEWKSEEAQSPLMLGNTVAATLTNPERTSSPNPRALTLLRNLSPDEENLALALTLMRG